MLTKIVRKARLKRRLEELQLQAHANKVQSNEECESRKKEVTGVDDDSLAKGASLSPNNQHETSGKILPETSRQTELSSL
jgi:hypothetical protein